MYSVILSRRLVLLSKDSGWEYGPTTKTAPHGAVFVLGPFSLLLVKVRRGFLSANRGFVGEGRFCYTARMETNSKNLLIGGGVILLALAAGAWWYMQNSFSFPLAEGDTVSSWEFQGSHKDDGELEAKVQDEIAKLEAQFGNPENDPTDYTLNIAISNQYNLLGDGESAKKYLERALAIDSETTGLAWHNMGALMWRVGAMNSARIAYANAVKAQPQVEQYHLAYLEFLKNYFSEDTALLEAAFASSIEQFENPVAVYQIKADWYTKIGENEKAIETWRKVQSLMPVRDSFIDKEIARLRAL